MKSQLPKDLLESFLERHIGQFMISKVAFADLVATVAQVQKDALEEGFEIAACFGEVNHDELWTGRDKELDMTSARKFLEKRLAEIKTT